MSSIENETGFMSLADLASLQTDEIEAIVSRIPDEGIFTVRGTEVSATQSDPKEEGQAPLFSFNFKTEILEAKPGDKSKDPERYVGRNLSERYTLWPADFSDMIGLLKGRYAAVGLDNKGNLGGVEGNEPGWLDGMTGATFRIRVRHFDSKGGKRAAFDWLPLEDKAAA